MTFNIWYMTFKKFCIHIAVHIVQNGNEILQHVVQMYHVTSTILIAQNIGSHCYRFFSHSCVFCNSLKLDQSVKPVDIKGTNKTICTCDWLTDRSTTENISEESLSENLKTKQKEMLFRGIRSEMFLHDIETAKRPGNVPHYSINIFINQKGQSIIESLNLTYHA